LYGKEVGSTSIGLWVRLQRVCVRLNKIGWVGLMGWMQQSHTFKHFQTRWNNYFLRGQLRSF